jgi:hypothetical protein
MGCKEIDVRGLDRWLQCSTSASIHVDIHTDECRVSPRQQSGDVTQFITAQRHHAVIRAFEAIGVSASQMYDELKNGKSKQAFTRPLPRESTYSLAETSIRSEESKTSWMQLSIIILPTVYGGIHLTALTWRFPTVAEHLIWRISCYGIVFAIPATTLASILGRIMGAAIQSCMRCGKSPGSFSSDGKIQGVILSVVSFIAVCSYIFFRVFIVLECFLSLPSVPIGAYWVPTWLQYIPHA